MSPTLQRVAVAEATRSAHQVLNCSEIDWLIFVFGCTPPRYMAGSFQPKGVEGYFFNMFITGRTQRGHTKN